MRKLKGIIINGEYLGNKVAYSGLFRAIYCISPVIIAEFIKLVSEYGTRYAPLRITGFDLPEDYRIVIRFANKKCRGYADLSFAVKNYMLELIDSDVQVMSLVPEKSAIDEVEEPLEEQDVQEDNTEEVEEVVIEESEIEEETALEDVEDDLAADIIEDEILEKPEVTEEQEDIIEEPMEEEPMEPESQGQEAVAMAVPMPATPPEVEAEEEPVAEEVQEDAQEEGTQPDEMNALAVEDNTEITENEETEPEEELLEEENKEDSMSEGNPEGEEELSSPEADKKNLEQDANSEEQVESSEDIQDLNENKNEEIEDTLTSAVESERAEVAEEPSIEETNEIGDSVLENYQSADEQDFQSDDCMSSENESDYMYNSDSNSYENNDYSEENQYLASESADDFAGDSYDTNNYEENFSNNEYQEPDMQSNYGDCDDNILTADVDEGDSVSMTPDEVVESDNDEPVEEKEKNLKIKSITFAKTNPSEEAKPIKTVGTAKLDPDTIAEIQGMFAKEAKKREAAKEKNTSNEAPIKMVAPKKKEFKPFKMFQKGQRIKVTILDENSFLVGDTIYKWGDVFYVDG